MAGSVNKVILIGNLGADPEVRHTQDGRPVVNLSLATSESWRDKGTGERRERTEWHRVVIFNENLCRVAEQYLKKGAKIYLEGQLQTRKYTDQQGVEKYSTEVVLQPFRSELTMLDGRASEGGARGGGSADDQFGQVGGAQAEVVGKALEARLLLPGGGEEGDSATNLVVVARGPGRRGCGGGGHGDVLEHGHLVRSIAVVAQSRHWSPPKRPDSWHGF
jgi:single-strand DNA-binding protein